MSWGRDTTMNNTIIDTLKQALSEGKSEAALAILNNSNVTAQDFPSYRFNSQKRLETHFAKQALSEIFMTGKPMVELVKVATDKFIGSRVDADHGSWVHDLSHITDGFWKRGLKSQIARLNTVAFEGAYRLGDTSCSDRLVSDFARSATWDAVPAEYGFNEENLRWVDKLSGSERKDVENNLGFIRQFPFESEDKCPRKPFSKAH